MTKSMLWPYKKSYGVGLFTDLNLYVEALQISKSHGYINVSILEKNLNQRVKGLKYIEQFKKRTFQDLIRELSKFKYIQRKDTDHIITPSGLDLIQAHKRSNSEYLDAILEKMNEEYVIPGWLVYRLWCINPNGQGQVVIPSPIKTWKPEKKKWEINLWDEELESITIETYKQINRKLPYSFPVDIDEWKTKIKNEYERLGSQKQRAVSIKTKANEGKKLEFFSVRGRLALSMKNVSVLMLFGRKFGKYKDFSTKNPMNTRNFMVWCPRLESFEIIYYSDYFDEIPGRVIFPCSVYKNNIIGNSIFKSIDAIQTPEGAYLHLHKPSYEIYREKFLETLVEVYETHYNKEGIIYVSLQQVRDEVCRLLRISATHFELLLSTLFKDSVARKIKYSIALETDIREDQKSGFQVQRRPVYINGIPHSLIALKLFQ